MFTLVLSSTARAALTCMMAIAMATMPATVIAGVPISGRPVPEFAWLDTATVNFMQDRGISAAVVGIMRNGDVVYLRGFGTDYNGANLPENTPMRLASVSKALTAAAIQHLVDTGQLSLDDKAFRFTPEGDGILYLEPFPSLGDGRFVDITIQHLLIHQGGWDPSASGVPDYAFREIECAQDMGIPSPPGRVNQLRWILGKPLQFTPGSATYYSNINFHVLHEIVVQKSGMSLEDYYRTHVLTPSMWVPSTEVHQGGTFRSWQDPREPFYHSVETGQNVYDPGTFVPRPYGSWHHEAMTGFGGFTAAAAALLVHADTYHLGPYDEEFGKRLEDAPLQPFTIYEYSGSLPGTNTTLRQLNGLYGKLRIFVGFNRRFESGGSFEGQWSLQYLNIVWPQINNINQSWPSTTADGFWTTASTGGNPGLGGYHRPFRGVQQMLNNTTNGSKIRMFSGTSNWTGVINKQMLIDAPLGAVTIGQQ